MNKLPKKLMNLDYQTCLAEISYDMIESGSIYLYDISNILIENIGRFCERYQTDFLVLWDSLIKCMKNDDDGIYYFGIRELGVDGNTYITLRLNEPNNNPYRKIFAVEFHKIQENSKTILKARLYSVHISDIRSAIRNTTSEEMQDINENIYMDTNEIVQTFSWIKEITDNTPDISIIRTKQ